MITGILTLPVRTIQTIADLPGRLESIERTMVEMQKLLAAAVEELGDIKAHTEGMHGHLGRIDVSTNNLDEHTQGLGDNTARLVRIAAPLERGVGRGLFRRRANGAGDVTASGE
jgi:predicted nuclease with TOPRIM domain